MLGRADLDVFGAQGVDLPDHLVCGPTAEACSHDGGRLGAHHVAGICCFVWWGAVMGLLKANGATGHNWTDQYDRHGGQVERPGSLRTG
jgi:hypothetical protein